MMELDIIPLIDEQDDIMKATENISKFDPDALLRNRVARLMKVWLLTRWYRQEGLQLRTKWIHRADGVQICEICRIPRNVGELDGLCVGCGGKVVQEDGA